MIGTRLRSLVRSACLLAVLAAPAGPALAQGGARWEVDTTEPVYQGVHASAAVARKYHIRNEGGVDGAGLCVIASVTSNGLHQEVLEFAGGKSSEVWRNAKRAPGGYSPDKLDRLFERSGVRTRYVSVTGSAAEVLPLIRHYTEKGAPVGVTMNTGKKYGYAWIHHMVQCVHLDDRYACVVDNNFPGVFTWMPADEFARRFVDGPGGWAVVFLKFKLLARYALIAGAVAGVTFGVVGMTVAAVLALTGARR